MSKRFRAFALLLPLLPSVLPAHGAPTAQAERRLLISNATHAPPRHPAALPGRASQSQRSIGDGDTLLTTLADEAQRCCRDAARKAPTVADLTFIVRDATHWEVSACSGAAMRREQERTRKLWVRAARRSTAEGAPPGLEAGLLPLDDTALPLRLRCWLTVEAAMRSGEENLDYEKVRRAFEESEGTRSPPPRSLPRSASRAPSVHLEACPRRIPDLAHLLATSKAATSAAPQGTLLTATTTGVEGAIYRVDGRGGRARELLRHCELTVECSSSDPRHPAPTFTSTYAARNSDRLLERGALRRRAQASTQMHAELSRAPAMQEVYLGPVLLDAHASALLFAEWMRAEEQHDRTRPQARLRLPAGLEVREDPTLRIHQGCELLGAYAIGQLGEPSRPRWIIRDGRRASTSAPWSMPCRTVENGPGARQELTWSNLFVSLRDGIDEQALKQRLLERCRAEGLNHGYAFRTLDDPDLLLSGTKGVLLYRVDAQTGHETLLRGGSWESISARTMRRIAACSLKTVATHLTRADDIVSICCPSVLMGELEVFPPP